MTMFTPIINPLCNGDSRIVNTLHTHNDILGELITDTRIYNDGYNRLISEIRNLRGKRVAHEIFSIDKERSSMYGYYLEVEPEYRSSYMKGFRFGEIMRLSSLITMIENNIQQLEILSKNTAVYFHSKYKFVPCITGFDDRNNILKSIIQNGGSFVEDLIKRAAELLAKIKQNPPAAEQREMVQQTNILAKNYIARVLEQQEQKTHPFIGAIDMKLTAENIIENKDFFNALFKRHGINYSI